MHVRSDPNAGAVECFIPNGSARRRRAHRFAEKSPFEWNSNPFHSPQRRTKPRFNGDRGAFLQHGTEVDDASAAFQGTDAKRDAPAGGRRVGSAMDVWFLRYSTITV